MASSARLGPFEVFAPLARGGMGEVWRGRHVGTGISVAVKVMTAEGARRSDYRTFFRNEVRAVANLDHPGIIHVFDHGEVDEAVQRATRDRLVAGSPYLAMEMGAGTLRGNVGETFQWHRLEAIILGLLDALAHAHARGVIHRDLKPANVLWFRGAHLKITDFGIAHAVGESSRNAIMGTPQYMSPEQLLHRWRDYGPWTDLYALGVTVWQLSTGRLPFGGTGPKLRRAHLMDDLPPLRSRGPVPDGFEDWLRKLMEKGYPQRFQCAADAAWALQQLGDPKEVAPVDAAAPAQVEYSTFSFSGTGVGDWGEPETEEMARLDVPVETSVRHDAHPPVPATWRQPQLPQLTPQLRGAGLGLWGLRSMPMVGRIKERDALWTGLRNVCQTGRPRLVSVHSDAGLGRRRMVRWLADRALEVGAAQVLRGAHEPLATGQSALRKMVERVLRCQRVERYRLASRLREVLPSWEEEQIHELEGWLAPEKDRVPIATLERNRLIERVLDTLCEARPVVMILDDVQWGAEGLGLVAYLFSRWALSPKPVLVLVTARDDLLSDVPDLEETLNNLLGLPGARRIELGPLGPAESAQLVRELLGLEATLAAQVEERCGGNPAFTIELVGDWVQRGLLELGGAGFRLRSGVDTRLPRNLAQVAAARIGQALEGLPDDARVFLERAAVLGRNVQDADWQVVCDVQVGDDWRDVGSRVHVSVEAARCRASLVERLLAYRVADETDDGWRFANGAFQECLILESTAAGRLHDHHVACASVLRHREGHRASAERIGRHLLEAGERDDAIEMLLEAVHERNTASTRAALGLLGSCEEALRALSAPDSDARWGHVLVQRTAVLRRQGNLQEAMRWANRAVHACKRHSWSGLLVEALLEKAQVAAARGEYDLGDRLVQNATELQPRALVLRALALRTESDCARGQRDMDRARDVLAQAQTLYLEAGDELGELDCRVQAVRWMDQAAGLQQLKSATQFYERRGLRRERGRAEIAIGDLWRRSGERHRAEPHYRKAIAILDAVDGTGAGSLVARMNLARVALHRGHAQRARAELEEVRSSANRLQRPELVNRANALLLVALGMVDDEHAWDASIDQLERALRRSRVSDETVADALLRAGQIALASGDTDRAGRVLLLAVSALEDVADDDGRAEAERLLAGLA